MNTTNRLWHVVAAVGLALLAVLLTTFYVTNYKHHVQNGESQVPVLVASKDIPVDTQGADIASGTWMTKEMVPRRQVVPGAVSSVDQIRNLIATEPTYAGEQVTTRRFGTPAERGVRAQLKGTQRVMEVTGDEHQLLAGTLRAGDHVDVVGGWQAQSGQQSANVARVFIRDLLVLSAPAAPKANSGGITPNGGFSAQLRLSDSESQRLEWMIAHGKDWRLEIRPSANSASSPRSYVNSQALLADGAGAR
jgi:Flp pilus assembly protein CpaB